MKQPLIRVTLFDATSENDFTLLVENGEYFVNFANRTGTYREFLRMLFPDDEPCPDLLTGDVTANFFALMKSVSDRWNDQMKAEVLSAKPGGRTVGNRRKPEGLHPRIPSAKEWSDLRVALRERAERRAASGSAWQPVPAPEYL